MKFLFGSDICFHYISEFPGKEAAEQAMASVAACFARATRDVRILCMDCDTQMRCGA